MPVDPAAAKSLFLEAAAIEDPTARAALIADRCGENGELLARVNALLAANDRALANAEMPKNGVDQDQAAELTSDYSSRDEQAGAVIAGKYTLVEVIGEGGMGSVWRAKQSEPVKRFVAVKLIKAGMDSKQVLARFEAERQALALMDHPSIAKVLDGGLYERRPFFVMELVKGVPITKYCDARKLTPKERLELLVQTCQAIQHAHQKGIIHRDIKPSNVLVALYDDKPVVKVIDFGVAKATGGTLTEATIDTGFGGVVGTPEYMSPEQATFNNLDIDTRTDVYALGALLYELLTGSPPFSRKELEKQGLLEILRVVREEEPPKPSTKLSTAEALPTLSANRATEPKKLTGLLRNELDWIVMKALEKDRTRRYDTANSFAADVQRYLSGEAVQAHPPSTAYRLRKFVRRNKVAVFYTALTMACAVAVLINHTLGVFEIRRERDRAINAEQVADQKRIEAEQAAAAEKTAKEQAQKRLAQIEKGVELFAGLLTEINPRTEEKGVKPLYEQLRERAENVADQLDAEAVGDPLTVARLQTILGDTLLSLGSAAKGVDVLQKARATYERELGADNLKSLEALDHLANAYRTAGKLPETIALLEQLRDARAKKLGPDHDDTIVTLHNLAGAYRSSRRLPEAIALFEQVREAQVKKLGAGNPNTLIILNNLANAYLEAGRKLPEAIALLEQVRDARLEKLGADHLDTLMTLNTLARAHQAAGKLPEAIALLVQVRDVQTKKLGANHPHTLITLNNLALAYQAAKKDPEAIALFEQAATGIAELQFQHEYANRIIGNTIATYEKAGQLDKAEGWRRKWSASIREKAGPMSPAYADELAALGFNLLQQKKWSDAESILRECLAIREKMEPDDYHTFSTQSRLGEALLGEKKYAEAEPPLLKGYEGMKLREKQIEPQSRFRLTETIDRLIELYTATNKPEELKKWQADKEAFKSKAAPAKSP